MPPSSLSHSVPSTWSSSQQRAGHNQSNGHSAVDIEIAFAAFNKNELFFSSVPKNKKFFTSTKEHLCMIKNKKKHRRRPTKLTHTHACIFFQTSKITLPLALGVLEFPVVPVLPVISQITSIKLLATQAQELSLF